MSEFDDTYPELAKMRKVTDKSQSIGEFVDWLRDEKEIALAEMDPANGRLSLFYPPMEKLLAEFFEIDLDAVERERRALLAAVREAGDG